MARLRTSLVTAMNQTKEDIKKGVSLEEAAHNAALTFNENENEIIKKVKNYIEKESRKTGKVGRPRKERTVEPEQNNKQPKTQNNTNNNKNKTQKNNTKSKMVADNIKENVKENENIEKNSYTFNGEVSIKLYGQESKINIVISTNETDFNKAKEYVLKFLYNANILAFINDKEFEKNLKNA